MAVGDLMQLYRCDGGNRLVQDIAQHRLALQHADPKLVVEAGHLPGDLQVEPAFAANGVGGHGQRAHRQVGLALVHQRQCLGIRLGADDAQPGEVAPHAFLDERAGRQRHR